MAAPSGITFREVNDADIPLPAPGKFTVYGRGTLPRVKDSMGNVLVLGNGIESIAFVSTVGLVDNYLITLQDGTEIPFTVTNAKSITTIAKVGTTGLVDTYRISFNNGAPVDFTVTNARSIVDIQPPANPGQPGATDTYQIVFNDGPNDTFIVYNGEDGLDGAGTPTAVVASPVGNTGSAGTAGPEYANPDHVHAHGNQTNPAHHAVATTSANGFMSAADKTKLDAATSAPTANTLVLRDATGMADFSVADVTQYFQNGVPEGFVKKYGSGNSTATTTGTVYNIARINFTANAQHIVLRGVVSLFQLGARQISFIASIRGNANNGTTKVIRYNTDESQFDAATDLGSIQFYDNAATGDCYLTYTGGAASITGISWSFESLERGNRQYVFMENAQTVLNTAGLTLIAPFVDPTGRVLSEALVGPRFTGNLVGDAATYGTPVALGAANAAGTALTFSRSDHVHAFPSAANVGALGDSGANGIVVRTAANTTTARTLTAGAGITVANADGTAGNPTVTNAGVTSNVAGAGITVSNATGAVTITNADRGTTAVTAHEQAADPHPQYTTAAEAAAAAPVQSVAAGTGISVNTTTGNVVVTNAGVTSVSVNGGAPQSGAVSITTPPAGTNNAAVTRTAPTASASTALTTIQSYPVAAGEITAGSEYEFFASLRVINTTAASNAVVTLSVGATNVLVLTQAIGTTAAAAPGAAIDVYGRITFYSATQAEAIIRASKQAAVAFDAVANTAATVTVSAAGATTIDLKFNTSAATSTFIARQVTIQRIK